MRVRGTLQRLLHPIDMQSVQPSPPVTNLNWIRTSTTHAETVVLIHAVGHDLTYWDRQIESLSTSYNVVAFDLPGHGRSPGSAEDWTFARASGIVADFVEHIGGLPVHLVGISFGGMIAQTVVLDRPELFRSLTLLGTAATFPESARQAMRARAQAVRDGGMAAVLESSLERWFTSETRVSRPDIMDRLAKTVLADDPAVHAAIWDIISDFDVSARLGEIAIPTLVLVGEHDLSTPPRMSRFLQEAIRDARTVVIPNASHIVSVESPAAVNAAIHAFLEQ